MQNPELSTKCFGCYHAFAEHFETYDGQRAGCVVPIPGQRDAYHACPCPGFQIPLRFRTNPPDVPSPNRPNESYKILTIPYLSEG